MKAVSLKIQITVLVMLLVAGLVAVFSWTVITIENRMILSEVLQRVVLEGRNLALSSAKPLLHADPEFELHPLVSRVLASGKDIVSIVVVDRNGLIKGCRDVSSIDRPYTPTAGVRGVAAAVKAPGEEIKENDDLIEVRVPVSDQGEPIGYVYLQYSKASVHAAIAVIKARMLRIGFLVLAASAVVSLLVALHVTRPINALTKGAMAIGQGRLDTRIEVRSVKEIQTLARTFNDMAKKLEESHRATVEQERIERELEIAHEIQATLLPARLPHLPNFEVDAYYRPASEVGGDYFDLIEVDEHRLMIVVGDVAGKGVPGLVVMAMVRILMRALAQNQETPATLLRHLNVLLGKDIKRNFFVTLFCGILDTRDGTLAFASAGHMPLIIYHGRELAVNAIATNAKPLAIFPDEIFCRGLEEQRITLQPGDCLVQFTDGLSEMRNAADEEYGLARLMRATIGEAAGGARHLVSELRKSLDDFRGETPQSDDLTIVAINAMPSGTERAPLERMERPDRVLFE
jgi:serine phosphatase RsbU (regulator of sigma subunit)